MTTSKKDQIKTAIMDFLNKKVGSVNRTEIAAVIADMGSTRTISRALAELKLAGLVLQNKDGKNTCWVSTEPKEKDLENDYSEVDKSDSNDPAINKKKKSTKGTKVDQTPKKKGLTAEEKAEQIASDADRKAEKAKNKDKTATPERDKKTAPKKPETFLYKIKGKKTDFFACGACQAILVDHDAIACLSCGNILNMDNTKQILEVAFNKLAGIAPKKIHDLSKLKKDFVSGLIDQILEKGKKKPTKKNIAEIREMLETTDFLDKLKKEAKTTAKKDAKKITKKNLVKAGKVNRNASTAGNKKTPAKDDKKADKKGADKGAKTAVKKVGVIATIIKSISNKYRTKKQILARLTKAFPEREADKMMKTINVQVPSRLKKDKGLKIEKTDKGYKIITK